MTIHQVSIRKKGNDMTKHSTTMLKKKAIQLRLDGVSYGKIAKRTGVAVATVYHWINGSKSRTLEKGNAGTKKGTTGLNGRTIPEAQDRYVEGLLQGLLHGVELGVLTVEKRIKAMNAVDTPEQRD